MSNRRFSLDDFKKWMRTQDDNTPRMERNAFIGLNVVPKVNTKRLIEQMTPEMGDPHELAREFKEDGGIVVETKGRSFLIEVDSGSFYIPRNYVKRS